MGWSQIFLDIEFAKAGRIEGECEFAGFEKQIVLMDFDWSMDLALQQGKEAKRRVTLKNIDIKKRFDSASVKLLNCLNARDEIVKAKITVAHRVSESAVTGGQMSLRRSFVLIATKARLNDISIDMATDGKSTVLMEKFEICFTKIRIERYGTDEKGRYNNVAQVYESLATDNLAMNVG